MAFSSDTRQPRFPTIVPLYRKIVLYDLSQRAGFVFLSETLRCRLSGLRSGRKEKEKNIVPGIPAVEARTRRPKIGRNCSILPKTTPDTRFFTCPNCRYPAPYCRRRTPPAAPNIFRFSFSGGNRKQNKRLATNIVKQIPGKPATRPNVPYGRYLSISAVVYSPHFCHL